MTDPNQAAVKLSAEQILHALWLLGEDATSERVEQIQAVTATMALEEGYRQEAILSAVAAARRQLESVVSHPGNLPKRSTEFEWTREDSAAARLQGWDIFEAHGHKVEIQLQRLDESETFQSDVAAASYVQMMANSGDALAIRAIKHLLAVNSPDIQKMHLTDPLNATGEHVVRSQAAHLTGYPALYAGIEAEVTRVEKLREATGLGDVDLISVPTLRDPLIAEGRWAVFRADGQPTLMELVNDVRQIVSVSKTGNTIAFNEPRPLKTRLAATFETETEAREAVQYSQTTHNMMRYLERARAAGLVSIFNAQDPSLRVNVRQRSSVLQDMEDEGLPGVYAISFNSGADQGTLAKRASIALDIFHGNWGIGNVDDFDIEVVDAAGAKVDRDLQHEDGSGENSGHADKISDQPLPVGRTPVLSRTEEDLSL